jgi:hypothetical protein
MSDTTYTVMFVTSNTVITTSVVTDGPMDEDYLEQTALEIVNDELGCDLQYQDVTIEQAA